MGENRSCESDVTVKTLSKLSNAVSRNLPDATFAIGGPVTIVDTKPEVSEGNQSEYERGSSEQQRNLENLIRRCQPATFGFRGKDVLDETYRKAGKLDTADFSTNFHPHDCGILDAVQQALLPSTVEAPQGVGIGPYGVRAKLYKLNIYSAPSGKFKSHVDTPRGPNQFGSLVVCLPHPHQGGALKVHHRGQTKLFDWGSDSRHSLVWAAFYSDCEHEVLEVTEGHRITLTYNLYATAIENLARPTLDPTQLPLYATIKTMLEQPAFVGAEKGVTIGFHCHHHYAHTTDSGSRSLPGALKGVDLAIFSALSAVGLNVMLRPVIEPFSGLSVQELHELEDDAALLQLWSYRESERKEMLDCGYQDEDDDSVSYIGDDLHGPAFTKWERKERPRHIDKDEWPYTECTEIIWMNNHGHTDFAYAGIAYGNQAELAYNFSSAAIFAYIPPSAMRFEGTAEKPVQV